MEKFDTAPMSKEDKECSIQDSMDEPTLSPNDELEWLREQYVVLKQNNDSLRQAYSAVGQEASALRRAMVSRLPTLRERAAIAIMAASLNEEMSISSFATDARYAVKAADVLIKELANG